MNTRDAFPHRAFVGESVGVAALLVHMVPARLKECAYAGFAINLVSALIAHLSIGDPAALAPSACSGVSSTSSGAACRLRRRAPDRRS
ncbi:DoxX family protein [Tunturiibacter gelidiferens]|uniref:DoxX family protein n=1 Tax=Tunturiibacter gelidiferens TaxID=3069689 RepID=UPI003D9B81C4